MAGGRTHMMLSLMSLLLLFLSGMNIADRVYQNSVVF
jgi:hypothetical protein